MIFTRNIPEFVVKIMAVSTIYPFFPLFYCYSFYYYSFFFFSCFAIIVIAVLLFSLHSRSEGRHHQYFLKDGDCWL